MSECSSCGATIIWGTTATGAKMPLSALSQESRWVFVKGEGDRITVVPTYRPHFSDCPNAASHRRPKDGD
jgi:hypothetical protein